ncbi:HMG box domain-containing protein [Mycena sanguinolenta]|uniref:HMG box domain-containing protein n=1 Tax=Mycena sanguinolenta TaxID=230812 RepID=A0A8H7DHV0_9AGAR|nr:HMG box domain-containing protein [Mycena sanguinolenta]
MAGPVRTPPKAVQPPRPPNAWILYRAEKSKIIGRKAQADVSKEISAMWKAEPAHIRAEYERRADIKKAEHAAMYPDYRFQPVKREEKERLRDVKKQEKERRKEAQRRGRANPSPTPAPVAAPQPSRHYALQPTLMFDPLAPYYQAEQRYGPSGPTPPLSAAPSPAASAISDLTTSRVEESDASPPTHASSYPQTPSSVHESPALLPTSFGALPSSRSPEPNVSESEQWKGSQDVQRPSLVMSGGNWGGDFGGQVQDYLTITVPQQQMQWPGQDSSDFNDLHAILSATGDPSIFELSNFDPQILLDNPTGPLEVSLGQMDFPFGDPIPNMADLPYYGSQSYVPDPSPTTDFQSDLASLFPLLNSAPTSNDFGGNYNADDFLNLDGNPSDTAPAPAVEQRSPETTPGRPAYVPPSGAAQSSTRRVGGKWRPPPESPVDQSPPTSWGVHA